MPNRETRATPSAPATQIGNEGGADWARQMQAYYSSNGSYRLEDVQRVLGDPRTVVGMAADRRLFAASLTDKK
jgi:hypothetical protein